MWSSTRWWMRTWCAAYIRIRILRLGQRAEGSLPGGLLQHGDNNLPAVADSKEPAGPGKNSKPRRVPSPCLNGRECRENASDGGADSFAHQGLVDHSLDAPVGPSAPDERVRPRRVGLPAKD